MTRSKWKGPFIDIKPLTNLNKTIINKKVSRNCKIISKFVGTSFQVHNGQNYIEILITEEMIGHKFGEFIMTRSKFSFKKKNK